MLHQSVPSQAPGQMCCFPEIVSGDGGVDDGVDDADSDEHVGLPPAQVEVAPRLSEILHDLYVPSYDLLHPGTW